MIRGQLKQDLATAGHDVTVEEWAVLLILQAQPGLKASALSECSFRDKTTVTRMVDRLVVKGLAERHADTGDRRLQRHYLTTGGLQKFARLTVIAKDLFARSLDGIGTGDMLLVTNVLRRMSANLDAGKDAQNDP